MISKKEYEIHESLKLAALQRDLSADIEQADNGELLDSDDVFKDLL